MLRRDVLLSVKGCCSTALMHKLYNEVGQAESSVQAELLTDSHAQFLDACKHMNIAFHREHVVPCRVIVEEALEQMCQGFHDKVIAQMIERTCKI
eukprot:12103983-Karenia_brevis.AAC.1